MSRLHAYRNTRDLRKTREPTGRSDAAATGQRYVMHKHDATQLHYDLRLEQDGVLRSWALPKGPSRKVGEKRLAIEVEDHPLEYGDFEGTIPADAYGGGTVMVWDRGEWTPSAEDKDGQIDFILHGEKLHGAWTLVRMAGKAKHGDSGQGTGKNRHWLLIKRHDAGEGGDDKSRTDEMRDDDRSVRSGRSMQRIAADANEKTDRNDAAAEPDSARKRQPSRGNAGPSVAGVPLTHPQRVVFPEMDVTKLDLARYFETMQDWIVPALLDRPLSLLRCLEGRAGSCFFQKHPGPAIADSVPRITIDEQNGRHDYVFVRSLTDLVALVQAGALELHAWGSRVDDLERPDCLVFDLDPAPDVAWKEVVRVARELGERLDDLGLASFVRTTGGKGLHLLVPLIRHVEWPRARAFAQALARQHARADPKRRTTNMAKNKRQGRVFIDYLRNARSATSIVSYSPRARRGAPVAVPIRWSELRPGLHSDRYDIAAVRRRMRALREPPWADFVAARRALTRDMCRAVGLE